MTVEVLERNNTQKDFVSYLNLSEGRTAYIIGNGPSRKSVRREKLGQSAQIIAKDYDAKE